MERLQGELAEWQGRCEDLEGQLQLQQAYSAGLEQDLKARPTAQQVSSIPFGCTTYIVVCFAACCSP